jgi:parvulin-like peptidyl-prolyl isomerase
MNIELFRLLRIRFRRNLRCFTLLYLILGTCFLTFLMLGCGLFDHKENKPIIVVGSRAITVHELKKDMAFISAEMNLSAEQGDRSRSQLLEQLIDHYLILEYAEDKGISISEKELESALQDIKREYTGDSFQGALLREDVDFGEWKARLREQLLINKTMKQLTDSIVPPSHQDIKRYFQNNQDGFRSPRIVRFRQIVTRTKEEAENLLKRLQNGEGMDELARKYSIAPEAENGGEVGWMARDHLDESMQKVLFSLSEGKISPVITTPYGYHIFEVLAVQPEGVKELPAVMQEIEALLLRQKHEAFYKKWLRELRTLFQVRVNQDLFNTLELS